MSVKILIIDDDMDTLKLVGLMLQKQGYQIVTATNGSQGLSQAEVENPDLILVDVMMPEMDGYEVTRCLRANPLTTKTPILMFTAKSQLDDKVTGFESGADDYLIKPTHPAELTAHVKALLARSPRDRFPGEVLPLEKPAYTIGVLSARGGLGVTTVAVNLGSAIQAASNADTIVAELRTGMGTLGPDLGIADPQGLTRLLQAKQVDVTPQMVKQEFFVHDSGLRVLVSSIRPHETDLQGNLSQMELIVDRLVHLAHYVVFDLGSGLTKLNQSMVRMCNQIIVILEPIPNTILHTRALITDLVELGINPKNIQAVLVNRIRSETQMNFTQVQEKLEHPVPVAISPAPELFYQAVQNKTIATNSQPNSPTGQQFAKLAALVMEIEKQQV